jgi:carbamate kinase
MLTDVGAVERGFGTPAAEPIREIDPEGLRSMRFASGSMAPKVKAACRFVEATGGMAAIGRLEDAAALLDGRAGTIVTSARSATVPAGPPAAGASHQNGLAKGPGG